jgi:hypothetical protein
MKQHNKVHAFTLSELSIVLLLSSVVVGLAFTVLGLVQKQMGVIQANFNQTLQVTTLETELWLNFNRYPNISYNSATQTMVLKNELDSVTYTFSESYMIKERDTLSVPIKRKQFYFDGIEVTSNAIDAMKLTTTNAFQQRTLFVYVKNDATVYMNTINVSNN